jgi:hypothetical protein
VGGTVVPTSSRVCARVSMRVGARERRRYLLDTVIAEIVGVRLGALFPGTSATKGGSMNLTRHWAAAAVFMAISSVLLPPAEATEQSNGAVIIEWNDLLQRMLAGHR